ncbi:MAG TPA: bifunctional hydroxymethylpyrimidine kinase/phosphomethylpyrimidine kinase [Acidobacteriaceae bacterium]|nr:bifunctional hydroxymethylpyrimidine kinase/phosphomethylpyrimidine kinase [Acidobacteriaceae bacterium]
MLSIAGFDPSGGAGILADLKTFAALQVYGMACITALTIQSTQGVRRVEVCDPATVHETLACLSADVRFHAIKLGMLGSRAVAEAVGDWLGSQSGVPVVLDPVLKSSSGRGLADADTLELLRTRLLRRADWITPNLTELAELTGRARPESVPEIVAGAEKLLEMAVGQGNNRLKIVATGGDRGRPDDLLLSEETCQWYPGAHIETNSTHGTGCTFSSALAARVALGDRASEAVEAAKRYVEGALRYASPVGQGKGPLNHFWSK